MVCLSVRTSLASHEMPLPLWHLNTCMKCSIMTSFSSRRQCFSTTSLLTREVKSDSLMCMCSGSVVVTAYDSESGRPGLNPEWGIIYYEAPITAQGLPEPSSLRGSTLGTRAAEHKGCNWACKLTDGCSLKSCVRPHLLAYATEIKSTQLHAAPLWLG